MFTSMNEIQQRSRITHGLLEGIAPQIKQKQQQITHNKLTRVQLVVHIAIKTT